MRVLITTTGSWGDLAPYVGLGTRLAERGHQVTVTAPEDLAATVTSHGLACRPFPGITAAELSGFTVRPGLRGRLEAIRWLSDYGHRTAQPMVDAISAAVPAADLLLFSPMTFLATHLAEALDVPALGAYLQPMTPTRAFAPPSIGNGSWGGPVNRTLGRLILELGARPHWPLVQRLRAEADLPPAPSPRTWSRRFVADRQILYGYSPAVVPDPVDWPVGHRAVGYWWPAVDPAWKPAPELEAFLGAGPPPICVSFGSMPVRDLDGTARTVVAAVRRAGLRAVVQTGWAGLSVRPDPSGRADDVLQVGHVPHEWLFPRVAAVVHHCGAGTTGATLRAGVPSVAVPFLTDQPFWAHRLHRLGVAPPPVPFPRLTTDRLAQALGDVVRHGRYRNEARRLAGTLSAEDGTAPVARAIEAFG